MNRKTLSEKRKTQSPHTETRTFRLRTDEIAFLESLSTNGITAGLRQAVAFYRAIGGSENAAQLGGADVTLAMIKRIERLESNMIRTLAVIDRLEQLESKMNVIAVPIISETFRPA